MGWWWLEGWGELHNNYDEVDWITVTGAICPASRIYTERTRFWHVKSTDPPPPNGEESNTSALPEEKGTRGTQHTHTRTHARTHTRTHAHTLSRYTQFKSVPALSGKIGTSDQNKTSDSRKRLLLFAAGFGLCQLPTSEMLAHVTRRTKSKMSVAAVRPVVTLDNALCIQYR